MALRVWLPLINDYKNYGLSDLEFSRSTKYRYIRFVVDAKRGNNDNYTQLSMFQFLDVDNNVYSYPSGTTVSTSMSNYSSSEGPGNILDGNVNTKFCCPWSAGGYLQINLGGSDGIDISKYSRFRWYTANDSDWRDPTSFRVLFSTDGTNFIEGVTVTNASITTSRHALAYVGNCLSDGKIGQTCHHNYSNSEGGLLSDKKLQSVGNNVSMFAWVNFDNFAVNPIGIGGTHTIIGDGYSAGTGMGFNVVTDGSKKVVAINTGTGNTRTWGDYKGTTNISAGTWYHIGFTYNGSQIKIYVNGVLDATHNYSGQSNPADYVHVASWARDGLLNVPTIFPHYKPIGRINDFRIYDHVLSTKEVKLLSQGLVAHYQLKGMGATNYLKGAGKFTENSPLVRKASDTSVMNDSYVYHEWEPNALFAVLPSAGTYTISVECDGVGSGHQTSGTTASQRLFSFFLQNVSSGTHYHFAMSKGADGRWYGTRTDLVAGTYKVRTNLYAADKVDYTLKFWDMKVTAGAYNPSDTWCPHEEDELYNALGLGLGNEPDCSGFGHNATKSGILETVSGSPRYGRCYRFAGSQYIACGRGAMVTDELTVSCWAYSDNWTNASEIMSCAEGGGWDFWRNGGGQMTMEVRRNGGYITGVYPTALANWSAGWHHLVGVYDGYKAEIYVDGVKGTTSATTTTKYPIQYHESNGLFIAAAAGSSATTPANAYFTGNVSDVRIYGTALSAADVADLYKNAASLTKDGKLMAYDFHENKRNTIDKEGVVATGGFNAKAIPTYDMKVKALGDGSTWARIHHLDVSGDKTCFANASEVAKCVNKNNRYSRMGIVDKYGIDRNTVFLLLGDSVSDCSLNKMPITNVGVTVSTAQSKFGGRSLYFNGSSRLNFPSWDLDGSDFTIDWWEYPTSATNGSRFSSSYTTTSGTCGGLLLGYTGTRVYASTAAEGSWDLVGGATMMSVTANTWTHWAFVKSGNTLTSFKNGVQFATTTLNGKIGWHPHIAFSIGSYRAGDVSYFTGYIDEFRISNVARWKTNFTPPSTSYREYEFMLTYPSMKKTVPAGYTELEYIQTTGTQFIRTGVYGYADGSYVRGHRWELDMEFTRSDVRQLMGYGPYGGEYWGVAASGVYEGMSVVAGKRDTIVHDYSGGTAGGNTLWVQNASRGAGSNMATSYEYTLFNLKWGGDTGYWCYAKLYRCKCIQGTTLIRDFVPAMRNSDGTIGLFDVVNNVFYTNAGSGSFLCNYSWLNYIEGTGVQYINTGIAENAAHGVEMECLVTGMATNWQSLLSGTLDNFTIGSVDANKNSFYLRLRTTEVCRPSGMYSDQKNTISIKNGAVYLNGSHVGTYTHGALSTATGALYIFANNALSRYGKMRLYGLKIYDANGNVSRDFIPCKYGNSIGLFDNVTQAFYGNAGTGTFMYGNKGGSYQWLDYIQNTGVEYINTGYPAPEGFISEAVVEYTSTTGGGYVLGSHNISAPYGRNGYGLNGSGYFEIGTGDTCPGSSFLASANTRYTIKASTVKGDSYMDVNGSRAITTTDSTSRCTDNVYVFSNQYSQYHNSNCAPFRLYSLKFWLPNGTLIRDFVPCISPSGKVGLYDKVTKRFYGNSGKGNLIAGTTKESIPMYNRWTQASLTTNVNQGDNIAFKPIFTSWPQHCGPLKPAQATETVYDCDVKGTGNWYSPIGQYVIWSGGIPAADSSAQLETELWVRTDRFADEDQFNIYDGSITATDYIEI